MKNIFFRKVAPILAIAGLLVTANLAFFQIATAATLTSSSDTMTNLNTNGSTSNDILFTVPVSGGGFPLSGTVTLTFASSAGTAPALAASIVNTSIAIKINTTSQTIATGTSSSTPVAATTTAWGFSRTSATVLTLTAPSSTSSPLPISAGSTAAFEVMLGSAAGGANILTHGNTANTETLNIVTSPGDSQTIAMPIIANDTVVVTATVNPTITFSLTAGGLGTSTSTQTNAVDFGALSSTVPRFATAGAASGGSATSTTAALDLNVGTNAASGYTLTFQAPTNLTDGSHPIPAAGVTTIAGSNTGTTGSGQFAMSGIGTGGSPTVPSPYLYSATSGSSDWKFATGTATTLASDAAPTSGDTVSVRYIANIPASQAPGNYAVTITYIATGNF